MRTSPTLMRPASTRTPTTAGLFSLKTWSGMMVNLAGNAYWFLRSASVFFLESSIQAV